MNERMKVMVAYDGSVYADAAINDLPRAGLPPDSEVLLVSVADLLANSPSVSEFDLHSLASRRVEAVLARAKAHRKQVIEGEEEFASKAADRLRQLFPEWKIESRVLQGAPADELLRQAAEWQPDLIVCGSQGRSAIGRFFLGSVSKKVAEEANCPVRVVRGEFEQTDDAPIKIIAGASSLPGAERVIESIGGRVWANGTQARLVAVDDGVSPGRVSAVYPYAAGIFEQAAESLAAAGLQVSVKMESGQPKTVLLEAAENWKADSIFVVASSGGETGLDETAASLVTSANCAVEIVR